MPSNLHPIWLVASLLAALAVSGCGRSLTNDISANASADGITSIRIVGEAVDLEILGETDRNDIEITGRAFAGTRAEFDLLEFVLSTDGDELLIEILTPGNTEPANAICLFN